MYIIIYIFYSILFYYVSILYYNFYILYFIVIYWYYILTYYMILYYVFICIYIYIYMHTQSGGLNVVWLSTEEKKISMSRRLTSMAKLRLIPPICTIIVYMFFKIIFLHIIYIYIYTYHSISVYWIYTRCLLINCIYIYTH